MIMRSNKLGPRAEYRRNESQRVNNSVTLAEKFPKLKSVAVELAYYSSDGVTRSNQIKHTFNLANARSVFRFDCLNSECVSGDFDLTEELANAVAAHRTHTTGEKCCQGWRSKTTIGTVYCHNILRYKLTLEY